MEYDHHITDDFRVTQAKGEKHDMIMGYLVKYSELSAC